MTVFGINGRNEEQKAAIRALMNDKAFTFLTGPAGAGKNLLAQAVGLESVLDKGKFRKLIYTRLQVQVGLNVGALPGSMDEKTKPFAQPFFDNLEVLTSKPGELNRYFSEADEDKRKIFFDAIQTIRGRSLNHTYLLCDEVQNLDPQTLHAIATRPGQNIKFVFLGNFAQIDVPSLRTPEKNGFYKLLNGLYEREAFEHFSHVNLAETQRNAVVGIVEDIMRNNSMAPEFEALEKRGDVCGT